jgi:hypothetical protein
MGLGGQRHPRAALPPGKTRYPLYRRLGGPQGRSGRVRKISPATGIRALYRQACAESLYRLRYPGPSCKSVDWWIFGIVVAIHWVPTANVSALAGDGIVHFPRPASKTLSHDGKTLCYSFKSPRSVETYRYILCPFYLAHSSYLSCLLLTSRLSKPKVLLQVEADIPHKPFGSGSFKCKQLIVVCSFSAVSWRYS